jgi:2-phosphosulfolactate phosphatase
MVKKPAHTVEVCFSPRLFGDILTKGDFVVVLADILRATTSMCRAFHNGVQEIIPVATPEMALEMKSKGYLVAGEQDGRQLDFADFGNSAMSFTRDRIGGRTLVYCTTNGTRALEVAKGSGHPVAIGAFSNLTALKQWVVSQNRNVVILCAGWKNRFCLEDTVFAGALAEELTGEGFTASCDSALAALDLWKLARTGLESYLKKAVHRQRLDALGMSEEIAFTLEADTTRVVPVFDGRRITDSKFTFRS